MAEPLSGWCERTDDQRACLVHTRDLVLDMASAMRRTCELIMYLAILDRKVVAKAAMSAVTQLHPLYQDVVDRLRRFHLVVVDRGHETLIRSVCELVLHWKRARQKPLH